MTLVNKLFIDMASNIELLLGHLFAKTCKDPVMQESYRVCAKLKLASAVSVHLASYFLDN